MADNARAGRMAKRIQQIVATALDQSKRDPRLRFITVTDSRVTGDLHDATVFYTVRGENIDDEPDYDGAAEALGRVRGEMRKAVGDQLGVRFTPTLSFELDTMPQSSAHMEELLAKARARDEELAKQREGATYAGDADPYKKQDEE